MKKRDAKTNAKLIKVGTKRALRTKARLQKKKLQKQNPERKVADEDLDRALRP